MPTTKKISSFNRVKYAASLLIIAFLAGIFLLSAIERSVGIVSGNILFLFDNARDLLYVQKLVVQHKLLLIGPSSGGLQGYFHGVFWYYLLSIPYILGNGNPAVVTGFIALLSLLSIVLAFVILQKVSGLYAAIWGTILYSFAQFSIATAKFPWNPYPIVWLMPCYFLGLYFFMQKRHVGLYLVAFLTGFFIHFEAIYGICLLPTLCVLCLMTLFRKDTLKQNLMRILVTIILFLIPFIPTLLFDLRHHFLITTSLFKTFASGGNTITHSASEIPLPQNIRFRLRIRDFYVYTFNTPTNNFFVNLFFTVLFLGGFLYLVKKIEKQKVFFLCLCIITLLSPLFFFATLKYAVWSYYWIGNAPLYTLSLSFLIGSILPKNRYAYALFIVFCTVLIYFNNPFPLTSLWYKGELQPGSQTLSTQEKIVRTIYNDAGRRPFSVYVSTPPVYDYIYRYLFSWTARVKHYQYPQDTKQHITYVILEFMLSDPAGVYFKKHVVYLDNRPSKTWVFPGVLVERIYSSSQEKPVDTNYFPQL